MEQISGVERRRREKEEREKQRGNVDGYKKGINGERIENRKKGNELITEWIKQKRKMESNRAIQRHGREITEDGKMRRKRGDRGINNRGKGFQRESAETEKG